MIKKLIIILITLFFSLPLNVVRADEEQFTCVIDEYAVRDGDGKITCKDTTGYSYQVDDAYCDLGVCTMYYEGTKVLQLKSLGFASDSELNYNYDGGDDTYANAADNSGSGRVNYWPVEDMCKVTYNTENVDSGDTGIIEVLTSGDREDLQGQVEYKEEYHFTIDGHYFGLYEDVTEAADQCKKVYNSINNLIKVISEGEGKFIYDGQLYPINPKSTCVGDDCAIVAQNINKEEALKRFFFLAYQTSISEHWKNDRATSLQLVEDYYEDIIPHSILADAFSPTFNVRLTNGSVLGFDFDEVKDREQINSNILTGNANTYSAYQRFGPNIKFIPYFGEQSLELTIFDKIYSAVAQDKVDSLLDIKDVFDESTTTLSTIAYKDRAPALYNLHDNRVDPRLNAASLMTRSATGSAAQLGNLFLTLANIIVFIMNIFITDKLQIELFALIDEFMRSRVWSMIFKPAINVGMMFGIVGLIFSLVKHGKRYAQGKEDARPFFGRFFGNLVILGLITILAINPTRLNHIPQKIFDINTKLMAKVLVSQAQGNAVVNTNTYNTQAIESVTWQTAIFNPWCRGMFQDEYEKLYTQYSKVGNKMKQSYQDLEQMKNDGLEEHYHSAGPDGEITYDSAFMTGDVGVPLGGEKDEHGEYTKIEKNWALFAWSTQSIYHIDSEQARYITQNEENEDVELDLGWPNARTAPNNNQIYQDTFRWIDAKLNISPGYTYSGLKVYNYRDARPYVQTFVQEGFNALKYALLLLVMLPSIFTKLRLFIMLSILTVQVIVYGIVNLFKEKTFTQLIPKYFDSIKEYFMVNLKITIMIILYTKLVGKANSGLTPFLSNLLFVLLCIVIQIVSIKNAGKVINKLYDYRKYGKKGFDNTKIDIIVSREEVTDDIIKEMQMKNAMRTMSIGDFVQLLQKTSEALQRIQKAMAVPEDHTPYIVLSHKSEDPEKESHVFTVSKKHTIGGKLGEEDIIPFAFNDLNDKADAKDINKVCDDLLNDIDGCTVDRIKQICDYAEANDVHKGSNTNKADFKRIATSSFIWVRYHSLDDGTDKKKNAEESEAKEDKDTKEEKA